MPTLDQIRTSLYDSRRERLPTLPQIRGDISFTGEWTKTSSGDQFLIADDGYGNDKLFIFGTDNNMKLLCESHKIHVDGTFQTCPNIFYQIFTIHAMKFGKMFPLIFAFLPNKTTQTYQRLFDLIKEKAENLQLQLQPTTILSDFELAIRQAVHLSFPLTNFQGCYYHYCQALIRRVQTGEFFPHSYQAVRLSYSYQVE